jgi:hypothetical protein
VICEGALTSVVTCEREFLQVLQARREQLELGHEVIEALTGLRAGSLSKMLSGRLPIGALSMWPILAALGLRIRIEEDHSALERLKQHRHWQTVRRKRKRMHQKPLRLDRLGVEPAPAVCKITA